jgi:hypothetical protein
MRSSRQRSAFKLVALMLVVWALPIAAAILLRPSALERGTVWPDTAAPLYAEVGERSDIGSQGAVLELAWTPSAQLTWPYGPGVVTETVAHDGVVLTDGARVLSVNAIPVFMQLSGTPLYRDITGNMQGGDVDWLDSFLMHVGAAPETTLDSRGNTTSTTVEAIRRFQQMFDIEPVDGRFRPDYTLYASGPEFLVGRTVAQAGSRLGEGSVVLESAPTLTSARIELSADPGRRALLEGVALTLRVAERDIPVSGLTLQTSDLQQIASVVSPATERIDDAVIARSEPLVRGTVPASAVLQSDNRSSQCLILASDSTSQVVSFAAVTEVPVEPGLAYVPGRFVGSLVLTNPDLASSESTCNSN